jgi:hypothetical protein
MSSLSTSSLAFALDLREPRLLLVGFLLQLHERSVPDLAHALQFTGTLGGLFLDVGLLDLLVEVADAADDLLLVLPLSAKGAFLLRQVAQLLLAAGPLLLCPGALLLLQGFELDLQARDLP